MRRHFWLLSLLALSCAQDDDLDNTITLKTRLRVTPSAFLGEQACRQSGGLQAYQATLIDVSTGEGFRLPGSRVVSCNSDLFFENILIGGRYIAEIAAFDRDDLSTQNPGSNVVVDPDGKSVAPRWTTTCWGDDRIDYGMGGEGGSSPELGVEPFEKATITVRGCDPLESDVPPGPTGVAFNIEPALLGLSCEESGGTVKSFSVTPNEPEAMGGAGGNGSGTDPVSASCGEEAQILDLESGQHLSFSVDVFENGKTSPSWTTTCWALTVPGVIVGSSCDPITSL